MNEEEKKTVRFDGMDVRFIFVDNEDRKNYYLIDKAHFKRRLLTVYKPLLDPILEKKLGRVSELKKGGRNF